MILESIIPPEITVRPGHGSAGRHPSRLFLDSLSVS